MIHSYLHTQTQGKYFKDHLFMMTGASGGNVGNGLYFSKVADNPKANLYSKDTVYTTIFGDFYRTNFLSSSLIGLLGRDAIQSTLGFELTKNRTEILQEEWEMAYQKYVHKDNHLQKDYLSFYEENNNSPLLLINSTHVQTGQYTIISPVKLNFNYYSNNQKLNHSFRDFFTDLQTSINSENNAKPETPLHSSLKLSTALSLNASFPYINSAGELYKQGQYVDAGYYDNVGGLVVQNVYAIFERRLRWYFFKKYGSEKYLDEIEKKVKLITLLILNDYSEQPKDFDSNNQYTIPINTLVNIQMGHTKEKIGNLPNCRVIAMPKMEFSPNGEEITTILPLGRYLSKKAVKAIEYNLHNPEVKSILTEQINLMKK